MPIRLKEAVFLGREWVSLVYRKTPAQLISAILIGKQRKSISAQVTHGMQGIFLRTALKRGGYEIVLRDHYVPPMFVLAKYFTRNEACLASLGDLGKHYLPHKQNKNLQSVHIVETCSSQVFHNLTAADTDTTGLSSRFLSYLQDILGYSATHKQTRQRKKKKNGGMGGHRS